MTEAYKAALRDNITRPRMLSAKHAADMSTMEGVDDPLDLLLPEQLEGMELWKQEYALSPLFTPTLEDRMRSEQALQPDGLDPHIWQQLVQDLTAEKPLCKVSFGDRVVDMAVPEDAIERHVKLLYPANRLDEACKAQIEALSASDEDALEVMALLRMPHWQALAQVRLLKALLDLFAQQGSYTVDKMRFLDEFVRTHKPTDTEDLAQKLENLEESYRLEQERPIFNQRLEQAQTDNIRSKLCGEGVKNFRLAQSRAILQDLQG
ncbi:hypothetical protein Mmc1_1743 [Magnetococcus marinus MC-1]|uniref:Uncharacterized protein n=1 Tax=Magnetococcus marinus (strain ATCC BAA-1437 / JCM 17883 / MC-1) TaxID=156889 RepID=A0L8F8_MAGMM|nr:hypothetical protein [Magnetococcus marinus]ABK44251.1 hypothetical protein Mmc1_1743 [Magnetococcus marinus MC-1]